MRYLHLDTDAISRHDLSPSEAIVFMVIKSFSNKEGSCFPAIQTIALHANISSRSVTRVVERLESKGLLSREIGGGRMSTLYHICNDKMSYQPTQIDTGDTTNCPTNLSSYNSEKYNTTTQQIPISSSCIIGEQTMKSLQEEDIILPEGEFTQEQRKSLLALLADKTADEAQVYLDELVGASEIRDIKTPVGYLRGMLKNGVFVPELGIDIAERRRAAGEALVRAEVATTQQVDQEQIDESTLSPEWAERLKRIRNRKLYALIDSNER